MSFWEQIRRLAVTQLTEAWDAAFGGSLGSTSCSQKQPLDVLFLTPAAAVSIVEIDMGDGVGWSRFLHNDSSVRESLMCAERLVNSRHRQSAGAKGKEAED